MKLTEEQVAQCLAGFVYFDPIYNKWRLERGLEDWNVDGSIKRTARKLNDLLSTNAPEGNPQ